MRWQAHICKSITAAENNDCEEKESENGNDSDKDKYYLLEEA